MLRETVLAEVEMKNRMRTLNSRARERYAIAQALKGSENTCRKDWQAIVNWLKSLVPMGHGPTQTPEQVQV
jgi:hypothetical protein